MLWSVWPPYLSAQSRPALPAPPGAVRVTDNLFVDESEVANIHWLEYLSYIQRDSSDAFYRSQLPDSTAWTIMAKNPVTGAEDPYVQYYFRYPGFRYYPLVGVSLEQARAYCRWRSATVNQHFFQSKDFLKKHPELQGFRVEVEYRLPTEEEWEQAARGPAGGGRTPTDIVPPRAASQRRPVVVRKAKGLDSCLVALALSRTEPIYPMPYNLAENYYVGSLARAFSCRTKPHQLALEYIYAHPPTAFGLYNLIGNVAELTATPGVAKGGSFRTSVQGLRPEARQLYQGPQSWLGFRCVATVRLVPQ